MIQKIQCTISGMHCTSCAMTIDGDLEDYVKGVKSSSTNYAKGIAEIEFDDTQTSVEKIVDQIKKTGYAASLAKQN